MTKKSTQWRQNPRDCNTAATNSVIAEESACLEKDTLVPADFEEIYAALRRAIGRQKGFGLVFVRCIPAIVEPLIQRLETDIPHKRMQTLHLTEPIATFFDLVQSRLETEPFDTLFVTGIEKSLVEYIKPGIGGIGDYYKEDTVPRILGHLNMQRERFRDELGVGLVFFLPLFAKKYFIHRAPDFFDWRTGDFEFPAEPGMLAAASRQVWLSGDYEQYCQLSATERRTKILEIRELIAEQQQTPDQQQQLWFELGNLLIAGQQYEEAIASYDQALAVKPDKHEAWYNKACVYALQGNAPLALDHLQRAIELAPKKYRDMAKTDADFASLRDQPRFQALVTVDRGWRASVWCRQLIKVVAKLGSLPTVH